MKLLSINKIATLLSTILLSLCVTVSAAENELPYYDAPEFTPKWLQGKEAELSSFHTIPRFSFTDQDGNTITEKTVADKIYIASFFFSTCPGICPSIRSKLTKVQEHFSQDDNVKILAHSIRPSTDTTEILKTYADENGVISGKWHLLTGDQDAIYDLAKNAYFANEDLGNISDLKDFLHTENLLLIDTNRHIRGVYNGLNEASVKHLITDIEVLKVQQKDKIGR